MVAHFYKQRNLPEPVAPPDEYKEILLTQPYGKGRYRLKCNIIKISQETTLVEAYSRLVRVCNGRSVHFSSINVEPYHRRVPTYRVSERYMTQISKDQD